MHSRIKYSLFSFISVPCVNLTKQCSNNNEMSTFKKKYKVKCTMRFSNSHSSGQVIDGGFNFRCRNCSRLGVELPELSNGINIIIKKKTFADRSAAQKI